MKPEINEYVKTLRFLDVRISAIFTKAEDARTLGFTEPTYYKGDFEVLGRQYASDRMDFCAIVPKTI